MKNGGQGAQHLRAQVEVWACGRNWDASRPLQERKGRGGRQQNTDVGPSLHILSHGSPTHPSIGAHSNDPWGTCLFRCLDRRFSRGLAPDVPPPAGSANNLWTHLTMRVTHRAYLIRRCPFLVQARKGSTGPSPALPKPQDRGLSQPLPQSEPSNTLPVSEPGSR